MAENNNSNLSEFVRKQIRKRYAILLLFFIIPVLAIFIKIFKVQFVEGKEWREFEKKQVKENVEVPPNRGNIFSTDGQLMASTVPVYSLYMDFQAVKPDTFLAYVNQLSNKLSEKIGDKSPSEYRRHLMKGYQKKSREYLISKKRVTHTELREIQKFPFFKKGRYQSGLYEKKYFRREKPFGTLASRTIGDIYGEFSKGGKNGLELYYDSLMRGTPGLCIRRKVAGRYISVVTQEPVDGIDLVTTIDVRYQDVVETALSNELAKINAKSGSAVLMEVSTGQIKAISNLAVRDSGNYVESENYAFSDQSEPGSTFKTFSMMVTLEDKLVNPDDSIDTGNGVRMMYGKVMKDHNAHKGGYHKISAAQTIWFSSNVGISGIVDRAYRSNPSKFVDGLYRIGINKPMQLEIPGAGKPTIPHPKSKSRYWAKTDLPWMSIGYVTKMPPIYTLTYYNGIANNGQVVKPYLVKALTRNGEIVKEFAPTVINPKMCSDETLAKIHNMLDSVVRSVRGTGKPVNSKFVPVAGKTGTAQISKGSKGYKEGGTSYQVSFCGFFPSDNPKYSCIVVIRQPGVGIASGGQMAGKVFREIAESVCSRENRLNPAAITDSTVIEKQKIPLFKSGNAKFTDKLLKEYKIASDFPSIGQSEWIKPAIKDSFISFKQNEVRKKLVPDVIDMGARDAVYLLEEVGLKVLLTGRGKVVSQSLKPGTIYNKGQSVTLILE